MKEKDINKLKWYDRVEWLCCIQVILFIGALLLIPTMLLSCLLNNFFLSLLIVIIAYIFLAVLADIDYY